MPTHHIRTRRFLNEPGHYYGAYIIAAVSDTAACRHSDCSHHYCCAIDLRISDCDRIISLDFSLVDAARRRNSLHKIDTLIDVLTQFRAAVAVEAERAAHRGRPRLLSVEEAFLIEPEVAPS